MKKYSVLAAFVFFALASCSDRSEPEIACTAPLAGWGKPHPHLGPGSMHVNIALDRNGGVYIDGKSSNLDQLKARLKSIEGLLPTPIVFFESEMGVGCDKLNEVRAAIDNQVCTKGGHCDEGIQSLWNSMAASGPVP